MEKSDHEQKAALRFLHQRLRKEIPPSQRDAWDTDIRRQVLDHPAVSNATSVFAYLSRNGEVDTRRIVRDLLKSGKKVLTPSPDIRALPHHGLLNVYLHHDGETLVEPDVCTETSISGIECILVPGIAWDKEGYRVGFGGGYFDRLLEMSDPNCISLGLAYPVQVISHVPREVWDRKVTHLVVPDAVSTFPALQK